MKLHVMRMRLRMPQDSRQRKPQTAKILLTHQLKVLILYLEKCKVLQG